MTDLDELAAWLRLLETPGVGRATARRLLATFGSPQAVFDAPHEQREALCGAALAAALDIRPPDLDSRVATADAWLRAANDAARSIVTLGDPNYPAPLLDSPDPPLLLYVLGDAERLSASAVAIVGSRAPTAQGRTHARRFAAALAERGVTIVSGLALGIDAEAHHGALDAHGSTIAVIGTGIEQVYPRRHRELARRILAQGAIVSEYPLGAPPLAAHFPQRNRIIAGLAQATLVVEAALPSGSLITARLANEAGRDVMAIPGSIQSPLSRGCHALIQQGAKLVQSPEDVMVELRPLVSAGPRSVTIATAPASNTMPDAPDPLHDVLLDALGFDPVTLDALAQRTGIAPALLQVRLLELELDGCVARLPGALFQRVARA